MPPRPKFTREELIESAYELMSDQGIDSVVAREVGKRLGTTTGPIFTYFSTMDELKEEVYKLAQKKCSDYLNDSIQYLPAFKEFGLRWIRFAKEYPNVYKLLFLVERPGEAQNDYLHKDMINTDFIEVLDPLMQEIIKTFQLSEEDARSVFHEMCIFAQGISSMQVNGVADIDEEEICQRISTICVSLVAGYHIKKGTCNTEMIKMMLERAGARPVKK